MALRRSSTLILRELYFGEIEQGGVSIKIPFCQLCLQCCNKSGTFVQPN